MALGDESIRQEAIEILRGLIETATINPTDEGVQIELVGDIVQLIALPDDLLPFGPSRIMRALGC